MAQAIVTKFLGDTNTKGSRIKVSSWRGNMIVSYDYAAPDAHKAAFDEWLKQSNEYLATNYPDSPDLQYKLISEGSNPCGTGNTYIIV